MSASRTGTRTEPIEHGTYGGYQQCRKRRQGSCEPCRTANREYQAQRRNQTPEAREKDRFWNGTRYRALEQLAREYPARFLEILDELRGDAG